MVLQNQQTAQIELCYRQVLRGLTAFEKAVLRDSYQEFLLKSQVYNTDGTRPTFSEMKVRDGRANSLHYKSGFAVGHHIASLKNRIPELTDTMQRKQFGFITAEFRLIESDTRDFARHQAAIIYTTEKLVLLGTFGDRLLLAETREEDSAEGYETFLVRLNDELGIASISNG